MTPLTQKKFAFAAEIHGLHVAEFEGAAFGIGTRVELEGLLTDGILPEGTIIREAKPEDF